MKWQMILAAVCAVGLMSPVRAQPPKNPPKNQARVFMSAKGLAPTSHKQYWIYRKFVCVKVGLAGREEFVPPGSYQIRVGFLSGYLVHEAEVKAGERYVIPTGLFTFKEVTPPNLLSTVPQELYSGDTYLATGYQGTTARLLPGKYTACYQDMNSEKPSECFSSWYVVGAFPCAMYPKGFTEEYPPEKETQRDFARAYKTSAGVELRWRRLEDAPGINLQDVTQDPGVAYAVSSLDSDSDKDVQLIVVHRNGIKVWLNGELVRSSPPRPFFMANAMRQAVLVRFKKGRNELFIKTLRGLQYEWPLSVVAVYCKTYEVNIEADKE